MIWCSQSETRKGREPVRKRENQPKGRQNGVPFFMP
nr:MAG TPA: hypothetical protein [Caudoviricetes sp.]